MIYISFNIKCQVHFVSTSKSAKRLVKMGRMDGIFNYGAMCNDSINQLKKALKSKSRKFIGRKIF